MSKLSRYYPNRSNKEEAGTDKVLIKKQKKGKHVCKANLSRHCYEIFGVDIFSVNGVGPGTGLTFIGEMGMNIFKFETAKHFTSWLRLAPNNRVSGGRVISSRTEKSRNQLTKAFRDAANAVGLSKCNDYLSNFFKRAAFKKGIGAAITATARKIAVIIWNMVVNHQDYNPINTAEALESIRQKKIKQIKKELKKYGIVNAELSIA